MLRIFGGQQNHFGLSKLQNVILEAKLSHLLLLEEDKVFRIYESIFNWGFKSLYKHCLGKESSTCYGIASVENNLYLEESNIVQMNNK